MFSTTTGRPSTSASTADSDSTVTSASAGVQQLEQVRAADGTSARASARPLAQHGS